MRTISMSFEEWEEDKKKYLEEGCKVALEMVYLMLKGERAIPPAYEMETQHSLLLNTVAKEIAEIKKFQNLDGILKLYALFSCCLANVKQDGEDFLSRHYILEKTERAIRGIPIVLDSEGSKFYESLKERIK